MLRKSDIKKPDAAPAPAPAREPVAPSSTKVEDALVTMAQSIERVAQMAAQASADAAAARRTDECTMEASIVRDNEGRMTRVVVRRMKNNYEG